MTRARPRGGGARAAASRFAVGELSSLLTGRAALAACFLCAFFSNRFGFSLLASATLLLGLLGLFARLWGRFALLRAAAEIDAARRVLSVGETAVFRCRVRNEKFLPLLWLEFCLPVPPRGCLEPDGGFTLCAGESGTNNVPAPPLYRRRLSLLLWYRTAEWESVWTARRRGVYQPHGILLRAGDGFGLTQTLRRVPIPGEPAFAVYPRLVPVETDALLKTVWTGRSGARGWLEDPAVLRGERDYLPGDAWKRIDWRMAARQETLQVKLFETVLPRSLHFVLDAASFAVPLPQGDAEAGRAPAPPASENAELEDVLSVLASLLLRLDGEGVRCGLSLPQTAAAPNIDLFPDNPFVGMDELLFQLAALREEGATELFSEHAIAALQQRAGQICLLTRGGGQATCRALLARLDPRGLTVLSLLPPTGAEPWADRRSLRIEALKRGGAV